MELFYGHCVWFTIRLQVFTISHLQYHRTEHIGKKRWFETLKAPWAAPHLLFPFTNSECLCRAGTWCCRCPREAAGVPTATRQRHHNKARAATMLRHHSRSYAHDRSALTSIVYWPARFVEPRAARAHPQSKASTDPTLEGSCLGGKKFQLRFSIYLSSLLQKLVNKLENQIKIIIVNFNSRLNIN